MCIGLKGEAHPTHGNGGVYDEAAGEQGPFVENGCVLLDRLLDGKNNCSANQ